MYMLLCCYTIAVRVRVHLQVWVQYGTNKGTVWSQYRYRLERGSVTAPRIAQTLGFVIIKVVCALSTLRANPAVDTKWALLSAVGCLN